MKLLVTGSASHLSHVLLPALFASTDISQVIGIDLRPSQLSHAKYQEHLVDIRSPQLSNLMGGVDAVVHLAFVVLRSQLGNHRHNRSLIHDINVNGSKHVFNIAQQQGVKKIVYTSSAVVYGALAGNPPLITEHQTRRVMHDFAYAEDKNAIEDWLDTFCETHLDMQVVRLRPHVILGPCAHPFLLSLLNQPFYPKFAKPLPLTQCVWETDVVQAILSSLRKPVQGAFNLAAQPPLAFVDMLRINHRHPIAVPFKLIRSLHKILWKFTHLGEDPGWLEGMPYSLAINTDKAKHELAWEPEFTTQACIKKAYNLKTNVERQY